MSECWHPALTLGERAALAKLFAAKDRFTVTELKLAPWGFDDDSLEFALTTGVVEDLDFWSDIGYDKEMAKAAAVLASASKKRRRPRKKGGAGSKGFGK
jgi:hypothetical protein